MTSATYRHEDVTLTIGGITITGDATGFGEPYILSSRPDVMEYMNIVMTPAELSATVTFQVTRSARRELRALAQGTWPRRASKGWRKHVRRMKAAQRRQGMVT